MNTSDYISANAIAAFNRDLAFLRETLSNPEMSTNPRDFFVESRHAGKAKDLSTRVEYFANDLSRLDALLPHRFFVAQQPVARPSATLSDHEEVTSERLSVLAAQLKVVSHNIFMLAQTRRAQLSQDWPGNPRLCDASLFGPLALRNKEVPLTNALAWAMTPHGKAQSLQCALLAATLRLILATSVKPENVAAWKVRTEEPVEVAGEEGRIDIFAEGVLDAKYHLVAIEAKINAPEGKKQLRRYQEALEATARKISDKEGSALTAIAFLTRAATYSGPTSDIRPISYAELLWAWLPVLKKHEDDAGAPFVRLLLSDVARDLADMHLGSQLGMNGSCLPRHLDVGPTLRAKESQHG